MKKRWLCFLLLLQVKAQAQNLLVNGGFEDENICAEYHINCAPAAWISTSPSFFFYFKDAKTAHEGDHFMGLLAGHSNSNYKRTFIRTRLLCSLKKDHRYLLRFFIRSKHDILDSAGVYFTSYDFLFEKKVVHTINPSFYLADASERPVKGDTNWQKVVINYTATGEENFLTAGYFAKNDLKGSTGIVMENNFLILVDDWSMIPIDPSEQLCPDWQKNKDSIYAQNERHEYLARIIKDYRNAPPAITRFNSTVAPHVDTLIIPDILFATGSAALSENSHPILDSFCTAISKKSFDSLLVEGHTDSVGTLEKNMKLSADRAQAVAAYIKQHAQINADKLVIHYYAFLKPVALNTSAEGKQKNRRVELFLYRHQ